MDNILKRAKDQIRVSIRAIGFISEHQGKVNIAEVTYNIQDTSPLKLIDPNTGKPTHTTHVYKKATESMDVATEPLIEDLMYINKFIFEMYFADQLGLGSEASVEGITLEDNRVMKLLLDNRTGKESVKQLTIFDKLDKKDKDVEKETK